MLKSVIVSLVSSFCIDLYQTAFSYLPLPRQLTVPPFSDSNNLESPRVDKCTMTFYGQWITNGPIVRGGPGNSKYSDTMKQYAIDSFSAAMRSPQGNGTQTPYGLPAVTTYMGKCKVEAKSSDDDRLWSWRSSVFLMLLLSHFYFDETPNATRIPNQSSSEAQPSRYAWSRSWQ